MEFVDQTDADLLEEKRREKARSEAMADALLNGNESLVYMFEALAHRAERLADGGDLSEVEAALGCIQQLTELGLFSRE